jgi:hypothetical protein
MSIAYGNRHNISIFLCQCLEISSFSQYRIGGAIVYQIDFRFSHKVATGSVKYHRRKTGI